MAKLIDISPLDKVVQYDDEPAKLYRIEIRDLSRGLCGALFLALPLHYTMEMWSRARSIPPYLMLSIILVGYLLNVGYCYYSNFKDKPARQSPWWDALESIGIGLFASAATLFLTDQLTYQMSWSVIISCIAITSVPTGFGASLAKSQLSAGGDRDLTKGWSQDKKKLIACLLGGIMFAFNVGATQEPTVISTSINAWQIIGLILFSLFVSYLMVFMTDFETQKDDEGTILGPEWAEMTICYSVSLIASAALLFMFGYLSGDTPFNLSATWVVVLGYATTLGGSAGRLVI
ncbi:DUF2391 family protein [Lewinella sp. 4G2]|uniref:DUF2391 family protein n=1 Tax=Lewinella sp. 4G2 TaxID=1803372 RepID=UPI0007B48C96|nr:DUF2391 family protein [Lewinella sp. 4G2]OAV44245.1 hypothetical protein A3850_006940 [Lewinella sp. 4G2]